ncbi:monovalent cation/H(+) antiporter subunit G [Pseudomonas sp.]|jgi:multicomponent Na+:H+ antiporter subunit G|uniref:monovalent cation/H(+) antiporter subunit G n=1 Tax=Pseudomonas sp. TaxID=306 RepID=UPI00272FC780|nr:monovalent cation/H(+) antiporter subunit G [Pseudomonas sp.]MDP2245836.1 monovalent cation/H(+) antiporter subunit G [Pseudomonas sp.]
MTSPLLAWLASFLVLAGALVSLLGAIGVVRLPDSYSRMHAASKTGLLGATLILAGVAAASNAEVALEVLLGVLVLLASAPLAAHVLSRAAYRAGIKPQCGSLGDALQQDRDKD